MHHDARMRQAIPFPLSASRQQQAPHTRCLANADSAYGGLDIVHSIVYCKSCCYRTTRGVNVEIYWFLGILCFKEEKLRYDHCGETVMDRAIETYYAFFQEAGEYII